MSEFLQFDLLIVAIAAGAGPDLKRVEAAMEPSEQAGGLDQNRLDGTGENRLAFVEADEVGEPRDKGALGAVPVGVAADAFALPEEATEAGVFRVVPEIGESRQRN